MKTAVSLPDELFEAADEFATRTGRSRSQLYAEALQEYLQRHDEEQITARLDQLAKDLDTRVEAGQARATRLILRGVDVVLGR
jgi:predicted transcriptional regulator